MEVLILSPFFSPNVGGVETHLDDLVNVIKDKSFKSYVLTYQPLMTDLKAPKKEIKSNLEIHRVEWFRKLFYKFEPYPVLDFLYLTPRLFIATFFFLLRHPQVKVIHAQGINSAFIAVLLKFIFKIKVVVSTHAVYEFNGESLFAKVTRWTFNHADKILSLLEHSKNELVKLGVSENKIEPYTYWVDQKLFSVKEKHLAKKELNWEEQKFYVLFVARLLEKKGVLELLEAAKILEHNNIIFHIAGSGPLEEKVKEYSNKFNNIIFHGKLPNQQLPKYFQAADVFIIPSTHEEGAGRVIMEALSCGTPVIGSNRGGIPEILDQSVGELIDVTPQNIADSILKIHKRISDNQITSQSCRQYAEEKFSLKNADLIIKQYQTQN
jgi:glycosyltransferase involved in cell wall biosynthesis